jgi:uncharacterized protein (DUF2237 family)
MDDAINVLGGPLETCSQQPTTGYYRDGCCNTGPGDAGSHTVCAEMTAAFLDFTRDRGNDLTTPAPAFGFPGLRPGDRWCLCAARWLEAAKHGVAPPVHLAATHQRSLDRVPLASLLEHAAQPDGTRAS